MRQVYYEEEQKLKDNRWLLVLLLIFVLGAIFPLVNGIYWQVIKGQPWGDKPMSDAGIISLFAIIFLICCAASWLLISMKLHFIVDSEGFHYKFFPNEPRWSTISKDEIIYFDFVKKNKLSPFGYRRHWFVKTKTMNVNGVVHLTLHLKNGRKIQFGSRNREGLEWAMKKLIPKNEII